MQDIFDSPAKGATQKPPASMVPPKPGKDIFDDQVPGEIAAAPAMPSHLTMDNIPAGHIAMTGPTGDLQAIPRASAGALLKLGWKVGPPQQQDPSALRKMFDLTVADPLKIGAGFASETGSAIQGLAPLVAPPKGKAENAALLAGPIGPLLLRMGKGYVGSVRENIDKSNEAAEAGKGGKATMRAVAAGLPLFGPLVGRAMDVGEDVESGKMSGPESAGRALSLAAQAASGAPEKSVIPNPLTAGTKVLSQAAQAAKIKSLPVGALTPAEQLAKTATGKNVLAVHEAAKTALPEIQKAAGELGQPIQTVDHAIDAAKKAKQNLAAETQAKLGEGRTLQDMTAEERSAYQQKLKPLEKIQSHLEDLQEQKTAALEKAAKSKVVPISKGQAAAKIAKGAGTAAVTGAVGALVPGGPILHGALSGAGLLGGGAEIARGVKGLIQSAPEAAAMDTAVANVFKQPEPVFDPSRLPVQGPDPFAGAPGPVDATVQPQPPAFTRPESAPVGKVARPAPVLPSPSEPYVSPRMAKILEQKNMPAAAQEAPASATEGFSRSGPPRSNLAKNRRQLGMAEDKAKAAKASIEETGKIPSSAVVDALENMLKQKTGGKRVSLGEEGPHTNTYTGETIADSPMREHVIMRDGKRWGVSRINPETGEATINPDIPPGTKNPAEYAKTKRNELGYTGMKDLIRELKTKHPEIKELWGKKTSERTKPGSTQRISLNKL